MALSRMHVKAQSPCYTELRAEATPVAIWSGIVDFAHRQAVHDCGGLHKDHRLYTMIVTVPTYVSAKEDRVTGIELAMARPK